MLSKYVREFLDPCPFKRWHLIPFTLNMGWPNDLLLTSKMEQVTLIFLMYLFI